MLSFKFETRAFSFEMDGASFACLRIGRREWFYTRLDGFRHSRNEHLAAL